MKRRQLMSLMTTLVATPFASSVLAQTTRFFRIGTGGINGTYYPIGGLIADIVSNPPGSRPCERGGACGVPGLVALAQTSSGSVANINAIIGQRIESGFSQSDIAYGAFAGSGVFTDREPASNLRAISNLYPESMHLVVTKQSGINSVADLRGKRISLDQEGSGTLVDAKLLLQAFGMSETDMNPVYVKAGPAISMIRDDLLDGLFMIAGYPANSVSELVDTLDVKLIAIEGPEVETLMEEQPFFTPGEIPADAYGLDDDIPTVNVGAQWITSLSQDDELIYELTRALWRDDARRSLENGHPRGSSITLDTALDGIAIPLHPGAARYYREAGIIAQ